ncbi:MAG: squalene cyclase, partial [Micrococcales bacterium]
MQPSSETITWLLDSEPSIRWQVERDLLELPQDQWQATRAKTATDGFGGKVLSVQDPDGQWAGGAYFPTRHDDRAIFHADDAEGQPYTATTWALNSLRRWGVDAKLLGDTAARLAANSRWEYDDLPYWDGEVDCCINAFTLSNGLWLGLDMSTNARWFLEHQAADGGWNCEWVEGSTRGSFHSTVNSLFGLLDYEIQ